MGGLVRRARRDHDLGVGRDAGAELDRLVDPPADPLRRALGEVLQLAEEAARSGGLRTVDAMDLRAVGDAREQAGILEVPAPALLPGSGDQHDVVATRCEVADGADGAVHPGAADRREMAGDEQRARHAAQVRSALAGRPERWGRRPGANWT